MPSTNLACKKFDEIKKKHFTPFNQELKHVESFQHLIIVDGSELRITSWGLLGFHPMIYNKFL